MRLNSYLNFLFIFFSFYENIIKRIAPYEGNMKKMERFYVFKLKPLFFKYI